MKPSSSAALPALATCAAYAAFNVSDATLKVLAAKYHFSMIMCINACFIILILSLYNLWRSGPRGFRTSSPGWMLARSLLTQVTTVCVLLALPHVTLTTFYTLIFTSPLWVALLSAAFMGEKLDARRLSVILFGFCVVLYVFNPASAVPSVWMLLVLAAALSHAAQLLVMRRIGREDNRPFMFICGSLMSLALMGPLLPAHFSMPSPVEWGLFAAGSAVSAAGLLCIAYAFQTAPAPSAVAPYHYTQIVWGALLGWAFFGEIPDPKVMAGSAAIIASGLYLLYGESRRAASS